jgi:hypothetical protein
MGFLGHRTPFTAGTGIKCMYAPLCALERETRRENGSK